MAASDIEWTKATWNPLAGCKILSPGGAAAGHGDERTRRPGRLRRYPKSGIIPWRAF